MHPNDPRLELIRLHLEGNATAQESAALEEHLRNDPGFRDFYVRSVNLDLALAEAGKLSLRPAGEATGVSSQPILGPWWQRRPLSAMAAGVVFGMFFSSAVWAYVVPIAAKAVTLFRESFESGRAPLVNGLPIVPGVWGGDFSEVVGPQQSVLPLKGRRMLRLLRADHSDKNPEIGYNSSLGRIIDLRQHQADLADGKGVLSVEASFKVADSAEPGRYRGGAWLFALNELPGQPGETEIFAHIRREQQIFRETAKSEGPGLELSPASAHRSFALKVGLGWQKLRIDLQLPPGTRYALLEIHAADRAAEKQRVDSSQVAFPGHFIDDIEVSLARSHSLP
jgi:hypothetical protein